jgi:hypothetical protein
LIVSRLAAVQAANEPLTDLRGTPPRVGTVLRIKEHLQLKDAPLMIHAGPNTLSGTMSLSFVFEEEVEILEIDQKQVTKSRTKHIKNEKNLTTSFDRTSEAPTSVDVLQGKVVLSELHDKKWSHQFEGEKPNEKHRKWLAAFPGWNGGESIPEGKQPPGTSWECDAMFLKRLFRGNVKVLTNSMKSTFTRLGKFHDDPCVIIESNGTLKGKADDGTLTIFDIKAIQYRTLTPGLEIKIHAEGTMTISTSDSDATSETKGRVVVDLSTDRLK